jgi:hypothetical protein
MPNTTPSIWAEAAERAWLKISPRQRVGEPAPQVAPSKQTGTREGTGGRPGELPHREDSKGAGDVPDNVQRPRNSGGRGARTGDGGTAGGESYKREL